MHQIPLCDQLVAEMAPVVIYLSVGDCRTAVCSSLYWSLGGLKQSAATKVADWWAPMVADC